MVEPSPPALHLLSAGDAGMACVGVKVEQEESGVITNAEPPKRCPSRDWSGNHPLEARQLTPPLSRSPSVRIKHDGVRTVVDRRVRNCQSQIDMSDFPCSNASSLSVP